MRLISENDIEGGGAPIALNYSRQDTRFTESRMDMVGYNVAPTRALDTTYQNTSGRTRLCIAICSFTTVDDDRIYIQAKIGPVSANSIVAQMGVNNKTDSTGYLTIYQSVSFIVPNGWYYQCATLSEVGSPTYALSKMGEYDLHSAAPQETS